MKGFVVMDLGTRLKNLRIEKGLSQRELADMVGCSHQTIALLERNENNSRIEIVNKLCYIFNVSADYLINGISFNAIDDLSIEEIQLILKYRNLSDYYKFIIEQIIKSTEKIEYRRGGE